jgi:Lhr-like helicase
LWFQAILEARPDWVSRFGLHHGSLNRSERDRAEQGLRNGQLKGVVCTSSLDLGVDFTPVDLVLQIGSPKGIARLIQRAGRSGHRPLETSRVICVPTHALELMEVAAARRSVELGLIEPRDPVVLPLDFLTQHLVSTALGDGFRAEEMYRELNKTHAFQSLTRQQFDWVLDFVSTGGSSLKAYPEFRKIAMQNGRYQATDKKIAARHRMNIGTITADAAILVKFVNEGLGALLAYRLTRSIPLTLSIAVNDYGLELLSDREIPLAPFEDLSLFSTDRLLEDILDSVNAAEMGRRQFREIARIAGLVFQGYPGRPKSGGQIQASSSLLYNVFQRFEPDNLLLEQSTREILERQLEFRRLYQSLDRMARADLHLIETEQITPLAFPIMVNRLRTRVSSERLADRVRRMLLKLEKKANM